ncbi:uncharacterized protein si:dkeyp-69c1.9 [Scophthalmus maximus]|uniref:uncharacterized protein si:dkeyp-69c1.9 n=1 Tax=Scophthalmus maximus TaxID=52904 RepID=UPI0015E0D308|nr:uncharacterized protein si:dkeyp-69c1.9 [Scophthalmus maximus]XP_035482695.1 uncharacterized protein si:dkeyp-69c1.9 [Scophthalmus maximus]
MVMPVSQRDIQEPRDKMFNPRHQQRRELFLRCRPYRGEPPAVAGFLLYPDTPAKMETTSQEAFCFRPVRRQDRAKGNHIAQNTQQESHCPHATSSTQTGRGNSSSSSRDGEPGEGATAVKNGQNTEEMQSQYQKDFPPQSSCRRRRTPAHPQPDNIGINPAFRIEFNTVQRETYPGWTIINPRCADSLKAVLSGQANATSERLLW